MANAEREPPFEAGDLEDMCKKRSEEHQSLKASYETWFVDQQQKLQAETEELEDELRQLKKRSTDVDLEDARATDELEQLLSRPWTQRDGSPDIQELFAEGDRRNTELRRIAANRERPDRDKKTILREIEKVQNKLEGLPAAYALIRKEETQRLKEKLEQLWQRQSQPDFSATLQRFPDEFMGPFSASVRKDRRKRSVSLETISSAEFKRSVFPLRPELYPSSDKPRVRPETSSSGPGPFSTPNTSCSSGIHTTKPQRRLSKASPVVFRDQQGRYQAERTRPRRAPYYSKSKAHQNHGPAPSLTPSRFGRLDTSLLPKVHAEDRNFKNEHAGSNNPERANDRLSSTRQAQDAEAIVITSVRSVRREVPNLQGSKTTGQPKRRWSPASILDSDPDPDLPIVKKQKAEKTILFDEISTDNRDWRRGDKIYSMFEYPSRSNEWYILPCYKHCASFPTAIGAARHLNSKGHGYARLSTHEAVRELGVLVVDCDAEKSDRNNDAFDRATELGYRPKQGCNNDNCPVHRRSSRSQRQLSEDLEDSESDSYEAYTEILKGQEGNARTAKLGQPPSVPPTVWEPILGEIYQAYWVGDHSWYPATVLPWGDLGEVGLAGSLDETDLFKERLPSCFAVEDSQGGLRIVGWKEDFKVHGRRASERKFPCMFFEGISTAVVQDEESPQPLQNLAWVMAKHLRAMDHRHSDGHLFNKAGLDEARAFRERLDMLKSKATREESRFSPLSIDSDSDAAGARQKTHQKRPMQHRGMKLEQDLDFSL